jgi:hypothetical protein
MANVEFRKALALRSALRSEMLISGTRSAVRTHAGQFFPWTFVIHLVHGPHAAGLSRRGRLWVYVSAGTGTWGPPVRLGTRPELTLLRLVATARPTPHSGFEPTTSQR